jgi:hypothetical protein
MISFSYHGSILIRLDLISKLPYGYRGSNAIGIIRRPVARFDRVDRAAGRPGGSVMVTRVRRSTDGAHAIAARSKTAAGFAPATVLLRIRFPDVKS